METTRRRIRMRMALVAVVAMISVFLVSAQVDAGGAEVTTGRFATTADGAKAGYDIEGRAFMVRVPAGEDGKTFVRVFVRGLDPNATYNTHVHNDTCAVGGGGHYQHDVGPVVNAVNEIWPTITTNRRGMGWGAASHEHWARPAAKSIVIHENKIGSSTRIACADLN